MDILAPTFLGVALTWAFILACLAFITVCSERNHPGKATAIFAVVLAALQFGTDYKPLDLFMHNPVAFVALVFLYVAIGVGYGVLKWFSFVRFQRDRFLAAREEYKSHRANPDQMDERDKATMDKWVLSHLNLTKNDIPPKIARNKARFSTWMMYWPMSAAWTFLNDPIRRAYDAIYARIANRLQTISDKVFAGIDLNH